VVFDTQIDPPHYLAIQTRDEHRSIPIACHLAHSREHCWRVHRISKLSAQPRRHLSIFWSDLSYLGSTHGRRS
jgi:hypothetical protein